jgi:hypothetical protein
VGSSGRHADLLMHRLPPPYRLDGMLSNATPPDLRSGYDSRFSARSAGATALRNLIWP